MKAKPTPIAGKAINGLDLMAEIKRRFDEFNAMTPEQQQAEMEKQAQIEKDIEPILQQLRGSGFVEMKVTPRNRGGKE